MTQLPQNIREVAGLSPDPRVRVFRRTLHGFAQFEGLEVDAYVVLGTSHAVILDTLLCPDDMAYVLAIIEPELAQRRLLCVNSHADWDHVWGNNYFSRLRPIPILAHEICYQRLSAPEAQSTLNDYRKHTNIFDEVVVAPPTLTFRENLRIVDESLSIELLHAPGHCHDQIVAWLPSLQLLLAFDALESPFPCIEDPSCASAMLSTLERLEALQAQHVLCSHGNTNNPALIKENLAYFQHIQQRCLALLAQHVAMPDELTEAATLIQYPATEALAHAPEGVDYTYYAWAHEQNVQAILRWLRK